jgi:hypothetical protein
LGGISRESAGRFFLSDLPDRKCSGAAHIQRGR